jgi:hypothetical protein
MYAIDWEVDGSSGTTYSLSIAEHKKDLLALQRAGYKIICKFRSVH